MSQLVNFSSQPRMKQSWPAEIPATATGATQGATVGAACVMVLPGDPSNRPHNVGQIVWSYNGAPTGGGLLIQDSTGAVVLDIDITQNGEGNLPFNPPLSIACASTGSATITLRAGGVTGKMKATVWRMT